MKTFVRVAYGCAQEVIKPMFWDAESPEWKEGDESRIGKEIPVEEIYTPDVLSQLVDVTGYNPAPESGWIYDEERKSFSDPKDAIPSHDQILERNKEFQLSAMAAASQAMSPLLLSLQLGNATDEEKSKAKAWQSYYRSIQSVDLTQEKPEWPISP